MNSVSRAKVCYTTDGTYMQIHSVFIYLALVLVIKLGIVEHGVDIAHEVVHRLVLLSFVLSL